MFKMFSLILLYYFLGTIYGNSTSRELKAFNVARYEGQIVSGYAVINLQDIGSIIKCLMVCASEVRCQSLFYSWLDGRCILNTVMFFEDANWEPAPGMKYYGIQNDDCPRSNGYIYDSAVNLCYKFQLQMSLEWPNARAVCQSEGGDLISLDTMEKYSRLVNTLQASPALSSTVFYVGATDEVTERDWLWVSGVRLPISSPIWAPGEPNNGGDVIFFPEQNYAALPAWSGQKLDDAHILDAHDFICEIKVT